MDIDLVVDASALVALILIEPKAEAIASRLLDATCPAMPAPVLLETMLASSRATVGSPRRDVDELIRRFGIAVVPFDEVDAHDAYSAFLQFGKGRHPAALNFGDCMVYALAAKHDCPILCTGDDFAQTGIRVATV